MKRLLAVLCTAMLAPWSAALAEVPFTFAAGDPIRASELNANFEYLDSRGAAGDFGTLTRRRATLSTGSFREVVTVPGSSTGGWVLRYYATNCGTLLVRIDNDPSVSLANDAPLVVQPGETLHARCTASADATPIGYFMFNEQ